jgi:hypothetical protein
MNQYLITAYDYTDTEALPRRMAVRQAHLDGARQLKETGNLLLGGAILDDFGQMIGSMMVMQFETSEELDAWRQQEPYITQGVWDKIEIKPFRTATL